MTNHPWSVLAKMRRVGVIGGNAPEARHVDLAEEMGRLIGQNGFLLVCGGMKGVMEAACRGARSAGGLSMAILPGKAAEEANPFVDIAITTGLGYMRNALVVLNSDILVAVAGQYGTLSEIAYAQIYNRTVLGLDTWDIPGVAAVSSPAEALRCIRSHFDSQL